MSVYRALLDVVGTTVDPGALHVVRQTAAGPVLVTGSPLPPLENIRIVHDATSGQSATQVKMIEISLPEYQSGITVAISYQSTCFAHLVLQNRRDGKVYNYYDQDLIHKFCRQAAMALEHYRLLEQRAQQQRDIEREREVIAREIHDGLGAALTNISFLCSSTGAQGAESTDQHRRTVESIRSVSKQAMTTLRVSLWSLENEHKTCRDMFELIRNTVFAPAQEAARLKLHVHDQVPPATTILNPAVRMHVVRVVQEVVQNILRHARARHITCNTNLIGMWMTMTIEDDGVGFNAGDSKPGHYGLYNMRKRMREVGGFIAIESAPGHGTRVTLRVPISAEIPYSWDHALQTEPYSEVGAHAPKSPMPAGGTDVTRTPPHEAAALFVSRPDRRVQKGEVYVELERRRVRVSAHQ